MSQPLTTTKGGFEEALPHQRCRLDSASGYLSSGISLTVSRLNIGVIIHGVYVLVYTMIAGWWWYVPRGLGDTIGVYRHEQSGWGELSQRSTVLPPSQKSPYLKKFHKTFDFFAIRHIIRQFEKNSGTCILFLNEENPQILELFLFRLNKIHQTLTYFSFDGHVMKSTNTWNFYPKLQCWYRPTH